MFALMIARPLLSHRPYAFLPDSLARDIACWVSGTVHGTLEFSPISIQIIVSWWFQSVIVVT